MTYPVLSEIVADTLLRINQVSGSSVQTYTEPTIRAGVNAIFDMLYNKYRWGQLWTWETFVLDGTTGKFTAAPTGPKQFEDFAKVRIANSNSDVPLSSDTAHMYVSGTSPLYYTALPWDDADAETKFIKFWPITATGSVDVLCGHRPDKFEGDSDKIPLDKTLIVNGTVWWVLADDGINPESASKAQILFDGTYADIIARLGAKPIGHGSGSARANRLIPG